ncbi:MAG TPA: hypothetical protein VFG11_11250 [Acidobacteriota bacterium]|nr:hypothetical protein [Acidobacteriota bacterium]
MEWKDGFKAFLIGHRNLFFFTPDAIKETADVNPASVDQFLSSQKLEKGWELLGFLSSGKLDPIPGYAHVTTQNNPEPAAWQAVVMVFEAGEWQEKPLHVQIERD